MKISKEDKVKAIGMVKFVLFKSDPPSFPGMQEIIDATKGALAKLEVSLETDDVSFTREERTAFHTAMVMSSPDPEAILKDLFPGVRKGAERFDSLWTGNETVH